MHLDLAFLTILTCTCKPCSFCCRPAVTLFTRSAYILYKQSFLCHLSHLYHIQELFVLGLTWQAFYDRWQHPLEPLVICGYHVQVLMRTLSLKIDVPCREHPRLVCMQAFEDVYQTSHVCRTIVRLRPNSDLAPAHCLFPTSDNSLSFITGETNSSSFTFDCVLSQVATQADVFDAVYDTVEASLSGQNGTIITYGQVCRLVPAPLSRRMCMWSSSMIQIRSL